MTPGRRIPELQTPYQGSARAAIEFGIWPVPEHYRTLLNVTDCYRTYQMLPNVTRPLRNVTKCYRTLLNDCMLPNVIIHNFFFKNTKNAPF